MQFSPLTLLHLSYGCAAMKIRKDKDKVFHIDNIASQLK